MSTELTPYEPQAPVLLSDAEIDRLLRVAQALAASGMFKDTRQAEQAFAKILVGRDLGLSPTQAMMGIHIVEGKPELSANLQAAFVKRSPQHDYKVLTQPDDDQACEIAFFKDGQEIGRSRFTMEDARKAGLANRGPWKSYPRNMLFARAISNGVAFHCPEVTGGLRVYSEGEISGNEQPPSAPPRDFIDEHMEALDTDADPHWVDVVPEPHETPSGATPATDPQKGRIRKDFKRLSLTIGQIKAVFTKAGVFGVEGISTKADVDAALDRLAKHQASAVIDVLAQGALPDPEHPALDNDASDFTHPPTAGWGDPDSPEDDPERDVPVGETLTLGDEAAA